MPDLHRRIAEALRDLDERRQWQTPAAYDDDAKVAVQAVREWLASGEAREAIRGAVVAKRSTLVGGLPEVLADAAVDEIDRLLSEATG